MLWDDGSFVSFTASLMRGSSNGRESASIVTPVDDISQYPKVATTYSSYSSRTTPEPEDEYRHGILDRFESAKPDRLHEIDISVPPSIAATNTSSASALPSPDHASSSAKELIGRYESMSKPKPQRQPSSQSTLVPSRMPSTFSETSRLLKDSKEKGRSPLRQSFRNLMSVFGKKGKQKEEDSILSTRYSSPEPAASKAPSVHATPVLSLIEKSYPLLPQDEETVLRSGPILHLCEPLSSASLPVWNDCSARLTSSCITLEWPTAHGNPALYTISLADCKEVKSLPSSLIDEVERNLLPDSSAGYVFELLFNARKSQRFAANSMAERSNWVGAIWDVISEFQEANQEEQYTSSNKPSETFLPNVETISQSSEGHEQCDYGFLNETSVYSLSPPTTPNRDLNRTFHSGRTPSQSIRNLSSLSVVKSRLAQMQSSGSDDSHHSPGMSSRLTTPPFSSISRTPTLEHRGYARRPIGSQYSGERSVQENNTEDYDGFSPAATYKQSMLSPDSYRLSQNIGPTERHGQVDRISELRNLSQQPSVLEEDIEDNGSILDLYNHKPTPQFIGLSPVTEAPESPFNQQTPAQRSVRTHSPAISSRLANTTPTPTPSKLLKVHPMSIAQTPPASERSERVIVPAAASPRMPILSPMPVAPAPIEPAPIPPTVLNDAPSQPQNAPQEDRVQPLMTLLQDHAMKQYNQTNELGNKIATLQDDMRGMSMELKGLLAEQPPGDSGLRTMLEDLCSRMDRVTVQDDFFKLNEKLDLMKSELQVQTMKAEPPQSDFNSKSILDKIEETRLDLKADLPAVLEKLNSLNFTNEVREAPLPPLPVDLSQVEARLTELLEICKKTAETGVAPPVQPQHSVEDVAPGQLRNLLRSTVTEVVPTPSAVEDKAVPQIAPSAPVMEPQPPLVATMDPALVDQIQTIQTALQDAREHHDSQAKQQADSARYLNELNSWLEKFVSRGSTQSQSVTSTLQLLCNELGIGAAAMQEMQDVGRGQEQGATPRNIQPQGLIHDMKHLLVQNKAREVQTASLENSVQQLVLAVTNDLQKSDGEKQAFATQTVVGMIDRQRQEQETMLRNIAAELSNDIRGERLRFVEAMKEATAINVQLHVEEFKKELSREVMMMTNEVGRLQRERQALEQQIADLFSFMAKQRGDLNRRASQPNPGHPSGPQPQLPGPNQPRGHHHRRSHSGTSKPLPDTGHLMVPSLGVVPGQFVPHMRLGTY